MNVSCIWLLVVLFYWKDVITTIANFCVSVLLVVYKYVMDCLVGSQI